MNNHLTNVDVMILFNKAIEEQNAGNLDNALQIYEKIIKIKPDYCEAVHNKACVLTLKNKLTDALEFFKVALNLSPNVGLYWINYIKTLVSLDRITEAKALIAESKTSGLFCKHMKALSIKIDKEHREPSLKTASAIDELIAQKKFFSAIEACKNLLATYPKSGLLHAGLGQCYFSLDQMEIAIANYTKATKYMPRSAINFLMLSRAYTSIKKNDKALENLNKAANLKPTEYELNFEIGLELQAKLSFDAAIKCFKNTVQLKPNFAPAYFALGLLERDKLDTNSAIAHFKQALAIQPDLKEACIKLVEIYVSQNRLDLAIENLEKLLRLKPEIEDIRAQKLFYQSQICDWKGIENDRHLISNLGTSKEAIAPFSLASLEDAPERHRLRAELNARLISDQITSKIEHKLSRTPARIRVGYFSSDFYDHATMSLMAQVFELHDKSRFEVILYSYGKNLNADMAERLTSNVSIFHDVSEMTDKQIVDLVRSERLDLAVDLKGYTGGNRVKLFAYALAPVQISYLGYPGTLGSKFIDYIIADPTLIPEEKRHYYSERIIYLPNSYQPNDCRRFGSFRAVTREEAKLPIHGFVFCCFNANYKITPKEFDIWMRLLNKVDGSVLWLISSNKWAEMNLKKEAVARGVDAERLVFAEEVPLSEHLARHKLADLFIDTFNVNAHTTASDALLTGLPVITKLGESFAARVAGSLLNAVGLPELVTENESDYEALILELSTNPEQLEEIKLKLADNLLSEPLFDSQKYTKHLENAYQQAFEIYRKGHPPADIIVPH